MEHLDAETAVSHKDVSVGANGNISNTTKHTGIFAVILPPLVQHSCLKGQRARLAGGRMRRRQQHGRRQRGPRNGRNDGA